MKPSSLSSAHLIALSLALLPLLTPSALAAGPTPQRVTAIEILDKATLYRKSSAYLGFSCRTAPEGVSIYNPAFDVTPHELIAGFITERGVIRPPFAGKLRSKEGDHA